MSFWAGVASGFKDAKASKAEADELEARRAERKEVFDYGKSRNEIDDIRYKEQQDELRRKSDLAVKQWEEEQAFKKDKLKVTRTSELLSMLPPGMASSLGGDTETNAKGGVLSKDTLVTAGSSFQAHFNTLSDKAKESDFFKAAAGDLKVQATLIGFMEAQAKKNNNIKMENLPKYFDYLGQTEGRGQAKAKEMLGAVLSGAEDLSDADSFIKGMLAFKNVTGSEALFMQKGAPVELKDQNAQIEYWETSIVTDAYAGMDGLSPDDRQTVSDALANVELDDGLKIRGLRTLAKFKFGRDAIAEHNMDVGYINKMYPSEVEAEEPTLPGDVVVAGGADTVPTNAEGAVTTFDSWAEATNARNKGFSGNVMIGGQEYLVPPLEGRRNAEAAAEADSPEESKDSWLWREGNEEEKSKDSWLWGNEPRAEGTAPSFEGSKLVKGDGESSADYQDRINPEVDIEAELEKEFGNASESDEMLNGETETSDLPDDETMRKYNADIEAIVKQLPQDASEEDKISMAIGAFMANNPELDPKLSEDDLEFLITSAIQ